MVTSKARGDEGESIAWDYLKRQGLALVARNYRVAAGPRRRGGEVDLIVRARDGTLVFVEVRRRASSAFGGAAASIGASKQQRIIFAARHFLAGEPSPPPCRFDVIVIEGTRIEWLQAAFDAG